MKRIIKNFKQQRKQNGVNKNTIMTNGHPYQSSNAAPVANHADAMNNRNNDNHNEAAMTSFDYEDDTDYYNDSIPDQQQQHNHDHDALHPTSSQQQQAQSIVEEMERYYSNHNHQNNYNDDRKNQNTKTMETSAAAAAAAAAGTTTASQTLQHQMNNHSAHSNRTVATSNHPPPTNATTLQQQQQQQSSTMINDTTRQLVKQYIADIWNRGDVQMIPTICATTLRMNGNFGFDRIGHDGLVRMVTTIRSTIQEYHCEIHSMVVESNKAFCRLRFTGIHSGGVLLGYDPTNTYIAWMGATEFTIQNNKIIKIWELGDVKSLEEQLLQAKQQQQQEQEQTSTDAVVVDTATSAVMTGPMTEVE